LADLRGQVVVLTFIYTRCPLPNFCPMQDQKFARLASLLGATRERAGAVRLLSVSFDPEHDTPEVLAGHARIKGAKPPLWTFAVATHEELRKVAEPLGLTYGPTKDEVIHNLVTAVIDPAGRLVALERGGSWSPQEGFRICARLIGRSGSARQGAADQAPEAGVGPSSWAADPAGGRARGRGQAG